MSTLNTFGFNIRRKRHQQAPVALKQDKTSEPASSTLAFEAPSTFHQPTKPTLTSCPPSKPSRSKPSRKSSSRKDPNQATLLPFFTVSPSSQANTRAQSSLLIPHPASPRQQQEEENEVCQVRRRFSIDDLLPILTETYGNDYRSEESDADQLLTVKPSKTIYTTTLSNTWHSTQERPLRRQRSENNDQVIKRFCSTLHQDSILDEFDSQPDEAILLTLARPCSTALTNSILLDIVNDLFPLNDNRWCASYC